MFPKIDLPEYPPMFTTTYAQSRASLTLTDGGAVLGVPEGALPEQQALARSAVEGWLAGGAKGTLLLPWPVDVEDLRGQMYERTK